MSGQTVEISVEDANLLVEAGVRYALPRMTGVSSDARLWLHAAAETLTPETRQEIAAAIRHELAREHTGLWRPNREDWLSTLHWLEELPDMLEPAPTMTLTRRNAYPLVVSVARYAMKCRSLQLQRQYAAACARYAHLLSPDEQGTLIRDIDDEIRLAARISEIVSPVEEWQLLADRLRATAASAF